MRLTFEVEGIKEISAKFDSLGRMNDFTTPFKNSIPHIDRGVQYNFRTQGVYFGQRWARLSQPYRSWKAKHYRGRGILVRTGEMKKSFYGKAERTKLEYSNLSPYYVYHQSSAPRTTKLPRRIMLKLSNEMRTEIFREFTKELYRVEKNLGFRI